MTPLEQRIRQGDIPPEIKRLLNQLVHIGLTELRGMEVQRIQVYFTKEENSCYCAHFVYDMSYHNETRRGEMSVGIRKK